MHEISCCVPIKHGNPEGEFHGAHLRRSRKKEEAPGELHKESKKSKSGVFAFAAMQIRRWTGRTGDFGTGLWAGDK